jgi:citrate lyase beta subunit
MAPNSGEVAQAKSVVNTYEQSLDRGEPAAVLNGRVITMPDYRVASLVLARAREDDGT